MLSKKKLAPQRPYTRSAFFPALNCWHALFFLLGILVFTGLRLVFNAPGSKPGPVMEAPPRGFQIGSPGPWGELEYTPVKLEGPDESFPAVIPQPEPISWYFENYSQAAVEKLFEEADLTAEQKTALLEKSRWKALTNGWQILPPLEVVRDMSLSARQRIYAVLRQSASNSYIRSAVRIRAAEFESWLADTALPREKQELIRKLVIPAGDRLLFCDSLLLGWLCSSQEKKHLAKTIGQTSALVMKLRVRPQSDIEALLRYWGRGSQAKAMRPFLESLTHLPQGASVSVSFFFPPFARKRLYTFPDVQNDPAAARNDCFWTAMNFFNERADYSLYSTDKIQEKLRTDYVEVHTNWAFGDLMLLMDPENNTAVHMCVYIADDVVFTKNGVNPLAPWVLMKRSDMLEQYLTDKPLRRVVYRKKAV